MSEILDGVTSARMKQLPRLKVRSDALCVEIASVHLSLVLLLAYVCC